MDFECSRELDETDACLPRSGSFDLDFWLKRRWRRRTGLEPLGMADGSCVVMMGATVLATVGRWGPRYWQLLGEVLSGVDDEGKPRRRSKDYYLTCVHNERSFYLPKHLPSIPEEPP